MSNESGKDLRDEGSYFDFSVSSKMDEDASVQYEIAFRRLSRLPVVLMML